MDILFFCKGYSSGLQTPRHSRDSSVTSTACPLAGLSIKRPVARTEAPVLSFFKFSSILLISALFEGEFLSKVN